MTVQAALLFLRDAREDAGLRTELRQRRLGLDLEGLVAMAAARGWHFDAAELREAFGIEWQLRVARSSRQEAPAVPRPR